MKPQNKEFLILKKISRCKTRKLEIEKEEKKLKKELISYKQKKHEYRKIFVSE